MQLNTKKYDAFCWHSFDYAYLRRQGLSLSKRLELQKILDIKNIFENGW